MGCNGALACRILEVTNFSSSSLRYTCCSTGPVSQNTRPASSRKVLLDIGPAVPQRPVRCNFLISDQSNALLAHSMTPCHHVDQSTSIHGSNSTTVGYSSAPTDFSELTPTTIGIPSYPELLLPTFRDSMVKAKLTKKQPAYGRSTKQHKAGKKAMVK